MKNLEIFQFCQAMGTKNYPQVGISCQRSIVVVFIGLIFVSFIWGFLEQILEVTGQPKEPTKLAGRYARLSINSYIPLCAAEILRKFLTNQSVVKPIMFVAGVVCVVLHPIWER